MKFEISPKEYETELNWQESILYCQFLDIDGYGWRLPTKDELNEIYLTDNDFKIDWYWTGTEFNNLYAWYQYFDNGGQYYNFKNYSYCVRAIRSIKIDL